MAWLPGYLEQWINQGLDLIYPRSAGCLFCGRMACNCEAEILAHFRARHSCKRCGKFLAAGTQCQDCKCRGSGFPDRVLALAPYEGAVREALHRLKYKGDMRSGRCLARLLVSGPGSEVGEADLIIPVPLHPRKLAQRGFNQAELLARRLARELRIPLNTRALQRVAVTQPQFSLGRWQRLGNLASAFRATGRDLKGKRILLVDDIITTGFTLEACGTVLREAGAAALQAVCVAAGKT